jgi:hypothetical protein
MVKGKGYVVCEESLAEQISIAGLDGILNKARTSSYLCTIPRSRSPGSPLLVNTPTDDITGCER